MKGAALLALLAKKPLSYVVVKQKGSHRKLESKSGYPEIRLALHDNQDVPRGLVRSILTERVGLTEEEALALF